MDEDLWRAELEVALAMVKSCADPHIVYIYDDDLKRAGVKDAQKNRVVRVTAEWIDISEVQGG